MAFGPTTSWQIDGETMETMRDFIFLASKIIVDGDCSHEIKTHLFQIRKGVRQGCILSPNFMRNAGLDEAQAEIKIVGRNINNLRYADVTFMAKVQKN